MKGRIAVGGIGMALVAIAACGGETPSGGAGATKTPTAAGTPTPAPDTGSDRSHPVPFGKTANVDGWDVKVVTVTPEAADPVNGKPPSGTTFYVFTLRVTNTTSTPAAPSLSLFENLVGSTNVAYSVDSAPMCYGGNPDNDDVYKGGSTNDGACIAVPSNVTGLLLNVSTLLSDPIWFATK